MAERRMFAKTIIDSDAFLDMPLSAQALYFHLSMRADDDGFLNNAKKIMRTINANQNDYDLLIAKAFIIQFDDGICVIKHWRINNYLRSDRYKPTLYQEQKEMLEIKDNGRYSLKENIGIPNGIPNGTPTVDHLETQYSIGKYSIDKNSKDNNINICPSPTQKDIDSFFDSIWELYPRKEGKTSVKAKKRKELYEIGYDTLKKCIEKYIEAKKGVDKQYILMGSTFFNGRYTDYLEENPVEEKPKVNDRYADYQ